MGYGFPAAIGAQIGNPEKRVIAVSGDGGMQMNIQEFATAVLEETPVIACVFNNTYLGMVRQWQKLFYGKRYGMTNLRAGALSRRTDGAEFPEYTPDFVKLAESYGAKGIRVTETEEIAAAFEEAKKNTKTPTLIEFIIDPEELRQLVWEIPTTQIAALYGVSDKAVEKRCRALGIPKPPRGYWTRLDRIKGSPEEEA